MATIAESSGNGGGAVGYGPEDKLEDVSRTGSSTPIGAVTPNFAGEVYHDTTNEKIYVAHGTTSTEWVLHYPSKGS